MHWGTCFHINLRSGVEYSEVAPESVRLIKVELCYKTGEDPTIVYVEYEGTAINLATLKNDETGQQTIDYYCHKGNRLTLKTAGTGEVVITGQYEAEGYADFIRQQVEGESATKATTSDGASTLTAEEIMARKIKDSQELFMLWQPESPISSISSMEWQACRPRSRRDSRASSAVSEPKEDDGRFYGRGYRDSLSRNSAFGGWDGYDDDSSSPRVPLVGTFNSRVPLKEALSWPARPIKRDPVPPQRFFRPMQKANMISTSHSFRKGASTIPTRTMPPVQIPPRAMSPAIPFGRAILPAHSFQMANMPVSHRIIPPNHTPEMSMAPLVGPQPGYLPPAIPEWTTHHGTVYTPSPLTNESHAFEVMQNMPLHAAIPLTNFHLDIPTLPSYSPQQLF